MVTISVESRGARGGHQQLQIQASPPAWRTKHRLRRIWGGDDGRGAGVFWLPSSRSPASGSSLRQRRRPGEDGSLPFSPTASRSPPSPTLVCRVWQLIPHLQIYPRWRVHLRYRPETSPRLLRAPGINSTTHRICSLFLLSSDQNHG
uniref:Uncharacterized protein n=1 Tax=Oryza glumipatula TaxID=40148 RepID=A0A0E0B8V5_9ORYZ